MSQALSRPLPARAGLAEWPVRDLPDKLSARTLLSRSQAIAGAVLLAATAGVLGVWLVTGLGPSPRDVAVGAIAVATFAYVVVIAFRVALVAMAQDAPVIRFTARDLGAASQETLPRYTVLV